MSTLLACLTAADLSTEIRSQIVARQGGNCFYCRKPIDGRKYVLDHFIPRSVGGLHDHENRVAAHSHCDGEKGGRMPTQSERERFAAQLRSTP